MDENNREQEIEEIAAYYEGIPENTNKSDTKADNNVTQNPQPQSDPKPEQNQEQNKDTDSSKDIKKEPQNVTALANTGSAADKKRIAYIASAAAIIIIGFIIGRFVLPVPDTQIQSWKNTLENKDKDYLAAVKTGEALDKEIEKLIKDSDEIEEVFDDMVEYQKTYDKLKVENEEKQKTLSSLNAQLKSLSDTYNGLKSELDNINSRTYTLSPGVYTVGVDIPEGNYAATGRGAMAVASGGISKINVSLDSKDYPCTLSEDDIIKLSTKARFEPLGE